MIRKHHPFTSAIIATGVLGLALTGCSAPTEAGQPERIQIVVTNTMFGDIVTEIAGDAADISVLIPAGSDPHDYQPSSQDILRLHTADLVVAIGAGFEESLESQLEAAESDGVHILELIDHIDAHENADAHEDHEDHDHADHDHADHEHDHDGHDHGPVDPHFWHNPELVGDAVQVISDEIQELATDDADGVQQRAAAYLAQLDELDQALAVQFAEIPVEDRLLITQHNVLGYFADHYGFTVLGSLIPSTSTLAQSSAAQLNTLISEITETGARAIFTDVTQSDALAETVAAELTAQADVQIVSLYTESLSHADGEASTYLDMMLFNANSIAEALLDDE